MAGATIRGSPRRMPFTRMIEERPREIIEDDLKEKRGWSERTNKYHMLQVLVALGSGLSSLAPGMSMGFSAVVLPQLRPHANRTGGPNPFHAVAISSNDSFKINATEISFGLESTKMPGNLSLTSEESAWFTSIIMATTPLGCFISGYLNDLIGRKGALLSIAFPGIIGWILLATVPPIFSPGDSGQVSLAVVWQMILGRALNGVAIGMSSSPGSVLTSETISPRFRGAALCFNSLFISLGVLLTYLLGDTVSSWRTIAAFGAIVTGIVALLSTTLPESPVWLRSKGRHGDADWVCYRLGLRTKVTGDAAPEVRRSKRNRGGMGSSHQECSNNVGGVMNSVRNLLETRTLKPMLILAGLFALQQASGIYVVTFNAVEIAASSGIKGAVFNSRMTAVLIGMCSLLGLSLVCIFIDRLGRRPTAISSASVMSLCMGVLAIYVQTMAPIPDVPHPGVGHYHPFWSLSATAGNHSSGDYQLDPFSLVNATLPPEDLAPARDSSPWHSWIPLAAMLTWAFSASMGLLPLPWTLPPELLPAETRSVGFGILSAMSYTFSFVVLRVFPSLVMSLGLAGCMFIMSAAAVGAALYVAALVPETKGMAIDGLEERASRWREIRGSVNVPVSPREEEEEVVVYG